MKASPVVDNSVNDSPSVGAISMELQGDAIAAAANLSQRMSNSKLSALRAQNPFLPIVPFPNSAVNVTLAAGVAQDVNIPDGSKFFSIQSALAAGGKPLVFCSRNGRAQIPGAVTSGDNGSVAFAEGVFIYCEEFKQFSIISSGAAEVALCFYQQL